ncbi:glycosyltransferase [Pseudobutyrivibrio xylanivorans]|uniref:Glycosyl transferase family 4 n=1 Tax=Pseudobutyrivibrio xylanivorans TaxID=185007 RepID=A0A5P6VW00_PSEXY|nr:glycosyltransferase [Pseudobutyrivibrio xylanivorans]QFJ56084.1 glycosyl transferase family 4 [Pseudobutyrivibrio xylanivorans]
MKILEINAYYDFGSTGHIVKDLCIEGLKRNYEMYAIYWLCRKKECTSANVIYCGEMFEPSKMRKLTQWIINGGRLNYNDDRTKRIISEIERIAPDIIHLHNLHGDFEHGSINIEMLLTAIAKLKCRVIWTFHDCWPITGRCYYFSYKCCDKWKSGCGNCPQRWFDRQGIIIDYSTENWLRKKKLYEQIEDLTVVTVSNWLNEVVRESMLKNRRIVTVHNGIDTKIFTPAEEKIGNDKFRILCIGWDRRKGYKDYYKLSKMLSEDEEIVVVGRRPIFRRFHRLPNNIRQISRATSKLSMAEIYRNADVYFNASPAETFGLTTVEALSCGTPVVGYRNTATTELLESTGCGANLAENGNVENVVNIIEQIKNSDVNRKALHEICSRMFEHSMMLEQYVEIYENLT